MRYIDNIDELLEEHITTAYINNSHKRKYILNFQILKPSWLPKQVPKTRSRFFFFLYAPHTLQHNFCVFTKIIRFLEPSFHSKIFTERQKDFQNFF